MLNVCFQVSYRSTHTAKIQTLFCVATNVTCRIREQSVRKRPVSWRRSTGTSPLWSICTWTSPFRCLSRRQWLYCLPVLEKQIFVHMCKISCSETIRHTSIKNTQSAREKCCECLQERINLGMLYNIRSRWCWQTD